MGISAVVAGTPATLAALGLRPAVGKPCRDFFSPFNIGAYIPLVARTTMSMVVSSHWHWVGHIRTTEDDKFPDSDHPWCPHCTHEKQYCWLEYQEMIIKQKTPLHLHPENPEFSRRPLETKWQRTCPVTLPPPTDLLWSVDKAVLPLHGLQIFIMIWREWGSPYCFSKASSSGIMVYLFLCLLWLVLLQTLTSIFPSKLVITSLCTSYCPAYLLSEPVN